MSAQRHPNGCTCRTHVDRPWNRPEHWTIAEVRYLEARFGTATDAAIARRLGRTVVGIRLKAKRLGLHKRDVGLSARAVAQIFGVDSTTVGRHWIDRGLLQSKRSSFLQGSHRIRLVTEAAVLRFIDEHPECIDVDKMPDSPYRDRAARDPWIGLAEVFQRTGRPHDDVAWLIRSGVIRGRRRGAHWYIPVADLHLVPRLGSQAVIDEAAFRRRSSLAARRDVRKGIRRRPEVRPPRPRHIARVRRLTQAEFLAEWERVA